MTREGETIGTRTGLTPVKAAIALTLFGLVALIWFAPDGSSGRGAPGPEASLVAPRVSDGESVPELGEDYPLLEEPHAIDEGSLEEFPPDERVPGERPGPPGL